METIKFTKEQLYWIERTADLESAITMNKFINLVQIDISKLNKKEKVTLQKIGLELMELHIFLKELRIKLEMKRKDEK